ncbi:MAG: RNA polymerase sigma factor [Flavobacteriales bacterium]|nr:RNA polymerase sigma factor [Flavobacteriales bacterium]
MEKNQSTFLALYNPVHESFARFCHARAYGLINAEDLMSETITCALENFHGLKNEKAFLSFLFSIASNIVNKMNRRLKFKADYDEVKFLEIKDQGIDIETRMDIELLYQALNILPVKQKEALILFEISGFSIQEIAEIQKAGVSSVKQRLKRGRAKLAEIFNSEALKIEPIETKSNVLFTVFL